MLDRKEALSDAVGHTGEITLGRLRSFLPNRTTHPTMPMMASKCIQELTQYRVGAALLWEQTKMTWALLLLRGVRLESDGPLLHPHMSGGVLLRHTAEYRKLVNVALWDLAKVLPFLTVLLAPGGSVLILMLLRGCPQALPSTFNTSSAGRLEVADRILGLERNLKGALIAQALVPRIVVEEAARCKPRSKVCILSTKPPVL